MFNQFSTPDRGNNQAQLGGGLRGANVPGSHLKGSYSKPLGRRAGSSGLSQAGKYIAQAGSYDHPVNNTFAGDGGYPNPGNFSF
jgi:hypothetical protein